MTVHPVLHTRNIPEILRLEHIDDDQLNTNVLYHRFRLCIYFNYMCVDPQRVREWDVILPCFFSPTWKALIRELLKVLISLLCERELLELFCWKPPTQFPAALSRLYPASLCIL